MKIGVIGVGYWGKKHVEEYRNLGHEVLISDSIKENLDYCRTKFNALPTSNYTEILQDKEIQAVSVCTPNSTHHTIATEVLKAGKNLLIEKPIATHVKDADEIMNIAKSKNLVLMVGHIFRFNNAIEKVKKIVRDSDFGEVYTVNLKWNNLEPIFYDRDILFDLGVHPIDIVDNIFGGDVIDVFCTGSGFRQENYEYCIINYRLSNSFNQTPIIVSIEMSWLNPIKQRTLTIVGSKNTLFVDCLLQKIEIIENNSKKTTNIDVIANNTIRDELEFFTESIKQKKPINEPMPNGSVAKRILEIIEKAKLSDHD